MKQKICLSSFILLGLVILFILVSISSVNASGSNKYHPFLIFDNIEEIDGYQMRDSQPWLGWENSIIKYIDRHLDRDFSDPNWESYNKISYRSNFARDFAFAYLITKDEKYAAKARESLLNLGVGEQSPITRASSLCGYGLAYDWMQPFLSEEEDKIIRDKYAQLADVVYHELNTIIPDKDYISFADYHGQAYPNVGIAGIVLSDYTNPNNLKLSSNPDDWIKVGTEYLFVNDKLHSYNMPLINFGFDEESGKNFMGAYKGYVIDNLLWWFQIYSHYYNRNIFDDYPITKKIVTSEIWETLPNGYMNNHITSGNTLETYHEGILNLLDGEDKNIVLDYLQKTERNNILPYSVQHSWMPSTYFYLVYEDNQDIVPNSPSWTNNLNVNGIYQVFRENWDENSEWLSLVTFNEKTNSNRDSMHHDQLSIEYYSSGDLLLADAGENKKVIDKYYGKFEIHHNSIAVEDPRNPFSVSSYGNSQARGVYKGSSGGIVTPVDIISIIQNSWVSLIEAKEKITNVIGNDCMYKNELSSPIQYSRTILFPFSDYFIIFDKFESDEDWIYRNIFRPTSLNIIPSQDNNNDNIISESETGHVIGELQIGGLPYDWLKLPYKSETKTDLISDNILWSTTNPYGNNVVLNLFSSPPSQIIITKHVGRIAGYSSESEVFSPIISFRSQPAKKLSRITLLLTGNTVDEVKSVEEIEVSGNGNAVKRFSAKETDYIYSGSGDSRFGHIKTDADILFIRNYNDNSDDYCIIFGGTYISKNGAEFFNVTNKMGGRQLKISGLSLKPRSVLLDDMSISVSEIYDMDDNSILVDCGEGDHSIEIISEAKNLSLVYIDQEKTLNKIDKINLNSEILIGKRFLGNMCTFMMLPILIVLIACAVKKLK